MGRILVARWHVLTASSAESEKGASLVEYALLGILIAVAAAIALQILGESASGAFEDYTNSVNNT